VAYNIRHGTTPTLLDFSDDRQGVFFIETQDVANTVLTLRNKLIGNCQILCPTHGGDAGTERLNSWCHRQHVGMTVETLSIQHAPGEPVIYGVNDYNRITVVGAPSCLWNGSMGTILEVFQEPEYSLLVEFDGENHLLKGDDLEHLELAYAITVHRAQGSQFPAVIIPMVRARNVDRAWIYTAITRAERIAILVGSREEFDRRIVEDPHSFNRRVALTLGGEASAHRQ